MAKICTSIEQSKKLLELGLSHKSADMYYEYVLPHSDKLHHVPNIGEPTNALSWYNKGYTLGGKNKPMTLEEFCIPCWSLGALLDVLKTRKDCNFITIHSSYSLKWILNTSYYELANWKEKETIEETLIDTVYNTIVWLLENGYIEKE